MALSASGKKPSFLLLFRKQPLSGIKEAMLSILEEMKNIPFFSPRTVCWRKQNRIKCFIESVSYHYLKDYFTSSHIQVKTALQFELEFNVLVEHNCN